MNVEPIEDLGCSTLLQVVEKPTLFLDRLITVNPVMLILKEKVKRLARSNLSTLIMGETGTGKELIAQAIYQLGNYKGEFVDVDCGGVPQTLLESEFFGARRGSYSGCSHDRPGYLEIAANGVLFLDEVGEIPFSLQSKLLRVLDTKFARRIGSTEKYPVTCRIVSATNQGRDKFRKDFFYRLAGVILETIPLRERMQDVKLITESKGLSCPAEFLDHDWPGNVRELINRIEELKLLSI